jgi:hypothetical protein
MGRKVNKIRLLLCTCINIWICTEILMIVPKLDIIQGFLMGFIYTFLVATTLEWFVHKYIYHMKFPCLGYVYMVHFIHHWIQYPPKDYYQNGEHKRLTMDGVTIFSNIGNIKIRYKHFTFYITFGLIFVIIPALYLGCLGFTISGILFSVVFSDLFIRVHDTIHRPHYNQFIRNTSWFKFLNHHHWIHHIDNECNLNFLLPLFDLMIGTIRFQTTKIEDEKFGAFQKIE